MKIIGKWNDVIDIYICVMCVHLCILYIYYFRFFHDILISITYKFKIKVLKKFHFEDKYTINCESKSYILLCIYIFEDIGESIRNSKLKSVDNAHGVNRENIDRSIQGLAHRAV